MVIDGQQRLLSIFFFCKGRFPKPGSRAAVRTLLNSDGGKGLSIEALADDDLFENFRLRLAKSPTGAANRFNLKSYHQLEDFKTTLDLRTIRNVVVKQARPAGNNAVFEIFSRLNTGGVNLTQQEIRASLYHSQLMSELLDLNSYTPWRKVIGIEQPDIHMRDSEIILRSLALARGLEAYKGSMTAFVNQFCVEAQRFSKEQVTSAMEDFKTFLSFANATDTSQAFRRQAKFSGVLFESVFAAWVWAGRPALTSNTLNQIIRAVRDSAEFAQTLQEGSTKTVNVKNRIQLASNQFARSAE